MKTICTFLLVFIFYYHNVQSQVIQNSAWMTNGSVYTVYPDDVSNTVYIGGNFSFGTGDLTIHTNGGTNSGYIQIPDGANANITIEPNGTGNIYLNSSTVQIGDNNVNATLTTNGTGDLVLNTNNGSSSGSITIAEIGRAHV